MMLHPPASATRGFSAVVRPVVVVSSAWPPAVGGLASFSSRLLSEPRLRERYDFVPHCALKRPSIFIPAERSRSGMRALPQKLLSSFANYRALVRTLRLSRPAIYQLHYNGPFRGPLFAEARLYLRVARRYGCRTVVRHGGPFHPPACATGSIASNWTRYMGLVDALLVQSPPHRDEIMAALPPRNSLLLAIVPNTVDTDRFSPERPEERRTGDIPLVGTVAGPHSDVKGAPLLLEALAVLTPPDARSGIRFSALAASPSFVERATLELGPARVTNPGTLCGDALIDWLRSLDVFVLASRGEGFPNLLVEAMACGCAVIATDVGAVPFIITDRTDGLLVPPNDPQRLAAAISSLTQDPAQRARLSDAARTTVVARFSSHGPWSEEIARIYSLLLRGHPGPTASRTAHDA